MSAALFYLVLRRLVDILRSEKQLEERVRELEAKVLVLQKQVEILERRSSKPKCSRVDRILLAALSRVIPRAEWSVFMVTPQTPSGSRSGFRTLSRGNAATWVSRSYPGATANSGMSATFGPLLPR